MIDEKFWKGKKVLVTGNTGFKGSWLTVWLHRMGAHVAGYSLPAPTEPSMYETCRLARLADTETADVRDGEKLAAAFARVKPEIVFHMAAQPLVLESYRIPAETYASNVMGTVNVLEAARKTKTARAVVVITTDKCYENKEWLWGYRENEPLGGFDPYSSSKACAEIATAAWRNSFFPAEHYGIHKTGIASARAGNVIGGGDWAANRLVPDCARALLAGENVKVRNPQSLRPWQHVLEPLAGYLVLAKRLWENGPEYAQAWNFGPESGDVRPAGWLVKEICARWGGADFEITPSKSGHEAAILMLDSTKSRLKLDWRPKWTLEKTLDKIVEWYKASGEGKDMLEITNRQLEEYLR
ncbi:MAG: CDP-glucose 4,6-dehydratase [Elusimicrobiales bacterium]